MHKIAAVAADYAPSIIFIDTKLAETVNEATCHGYLSRNSGFLKFLELLRFWLQRRSSLSFNLSEPGIYRFKEPSKPFFCLWCDNGGCVLCHFSNE